MITTSSGSKHVINALPSFFFRTTMGAVQSTRRRRLDMAPAPAPSPSRAQAPAPSPPRVPNAQFRVLIIGRANAGKTSILQKVCDTTESPEIYRSGLSGTRDQVRPHSQWRFQSHRSHHLIQVKLDPTIEVRWLYFCRRQLIMKIPPTAWLPQH